MSDKKTCARCNGSGLYEEGTTEPAKNAYCEPCGGLGITYQSMVDQVRGGTRSLSMMLLEMQTPQGKE